MKRILVIILVLSAVVQVDAQYKRRLNPIFTEAIGYPKGGWFFEPGITYAYTQGEMKNRIIKETQDSLVVADITPSSFPFIYLGAGRFNLLPNSPFINLIDYGLAFKGVIYNQDTRGNLFFKDDNSIPPEQFDDEGRWSDYNITANLNLNHYIQISESVFIMPGMGLNADFRVGGTESYSIPDTSITGYRFPETVRFFAHARINVGIKIHRELFIVPGFEVPLVNLKQTQNAKVTQTYWNSEYWPMLLSVKVMYHKPPRRKPCKVGVSDIDLNNTRRRKRKIQLY
ncbi:hypothetical protein [Luteibaculum oceani]|uniref:Outer membrane beta-barrel protein n=1 Tax=Luteibaculum oceani TaxID=1294296 RepID=A0A5C6VAD0_9FLAO|nr:hypothetical protein [Luteibaculum oceani]TXC81790.1 hypothetical protein FRX97_04535 [Luteibaculum oceani]